MTKKSKKSNITKKHKENFNVLTTFPNMHALFSCFLDGKPTSAIIRVEQEADGYKFTPIFVAVTPDMKLTDHEGQETEE